MRFNDVGTHPLETFPPLPSRAVFEWVDANGPRSAVVETRGVLGSAEGAGIVVVDPSVSRLHAEVDPRADGVWIRDLGSKNGTSVNGVTVVEARIPERAIVKLGRVEVRVSYEEPSPPSGYWPEPRFGPLIGHAIVMRRLFTELARIAATSFSVLVNGETGTGKDLVARAIHEASPRAGGPFVVIDCAAVPPHLMESELFGHARGAFTGAVNAKAGPFEEASGGTVFLDEIAELPLDLQPKLLRVLESRTTRRVGEHQHRPIDVRVIAATHRSLPELVSKGAFREDLYFRLAVLPIEVPPLRERLDDIPLLLERFLGPAARQIMTPQALAELRALPWLGNVRELRNFAERSIALGQKRAMQMATLPAGAPETERITLDVPRSAPMREYRESLLRQGEREYVKRLLARHGGNIAAASKEAELDRSHFYRIVRRLDL
jgi:DNA-binding NtrC family response regulator